jgi:mono/diheme cytochrome c family protein
MMTMLVLGYVAVTEQERMASFTVAYDARMVEAGAALYESNCASCHGLNGQGGAAPALNAADLFNGSRLREINWVGGTEAFIRGTITAGRPRASAVFSTYPQRMPAWGQNYGGPLRSDQIETLVAFVMNWGESYKDASGNYILATPTPNPNAVGTDLSVELPEGNADNGKQVTEQRACVACHIAGAGASAPAWEADKDAEGKGVGTHAEERYLSAEYTGRADSAELYLLESLIQPSTYIVAGQATWNINGVSAMPNIYGEQLTKQDAADVIAYLLTLK